VESSARRRWLGGFSLTDSIWPNSPRTMTSRCPRGSCRQEARGWQREDNIRSERASSEKKGEGGEYVQVDKKVYYIEYIICMGMLTML
jgi:hypothetical protein